MASRLQDVILRGTAASRPVATAVAPGTLYYSTDTAVTERCADDGLSWETYSDGGAVGAPTGASYVTLATNGTLTSERVLTAGTGITLTDGGAGSTITVAASGGSAGLVLLEQHTASSSATLDFTTWYSSTYDLYQIEFLNLVPATANVDLYIRVSTNGGSSYDTSNNYATSVLTWVSNISGNAGNALGSLTGHWMLRGNADATNSASYGFVGTAKLFNPGGSAFKAWRGSFAYNTGSVYAGLETASVYTSASAVNAFRVLMSSGNIASGTIRVYGLAK